MESPPKIHNKSNQTIYLIPFSRHNNENPFKKYDVKTGKVKSIQEGGVREVKSSDYNLSGTTNHFQIYILFRAVNCGRTVQQAAEEKRYTYAKLQQKGELYLGLNAKGQVIEVDNAGRPLNMKMTHISPHAASNQNESELQYLREQVKSLMEVAESLWKILTDLTEHT